MKLGAMRIALVCLLFFLTLPAFAQRGTLGLDVGETSDLFQGGSGRATSALVGVDGQVAILKGSPKDDLPSLVAGGEILLPSDTSAHATEFAAFTGPEFQFGHHFFAGFHVEARKVYLPAGTLNGELFGRKNMLLLELPALVGYRFGPGNHAFIEAQGSAEFSPHFTSTANSQSIYPNPTFDHGYVVRAIAGYTFGRWYAKATYETRFLKFGQNISNPNDLYNWRTDAVFAGFGLSF
jgi:hypothetical protein